MISLLFQGKLQKHQAFEAEISAHSNAIVELQENGESMISESHYASDLIRVSYVLYSHFVFVLLFFRQELCVLTTCSTVNFPSDYCKIALILCVTVIFFFFKLNTKIANIQQERLDSLIKLWELLLSKSAEKGRMLLFTQKRVHFLRETEEVMSWILEKVRACLLIVKKIDSAIPIK